LRKLASLTDRHIRDAAYVRTGNFICKLSKLLAFLLTAYQTHSTLAVHYERLIGIRASIVLYCVVKYVYKHGLHIINALTV